MDHVYDYMYHLIVEYSKLQDFKPAPPSLAQEVCVESILCVADKQQDLRLLPLCHALFFHPASNWCVCETVKL